MGKTSREKRPIQAYFELHIEQARSSRDSEDHRNPQRDPGISYDLLVEEGEPGRPHPMEDRRDAPAPPEMILAVNALPARMGEKWSQP
jgi:hypothetical protein